MLHCCSIKWRHFRYRVSVSSNAILFGIGYRVSFWYCSNPSCKKCLRRANVLSGCSRHVPRQQQSSCRQVCVATAHDLSVDERSRHLGPSETKCMSSIKYGGSAVLAVIDEWLPVCSWLLLTIKLIWHCASHDSYVGLYDEVKLLLNIIQTAALLEVSCLLLDS